MALLFRSFTLSTSLVLSVADRRRLLLDRIAFGLRVFVRKPGTVLRQRTHAGFASVVTTPPGFE